MNCNSLEVSRADPLRVYATFGSWPGIYRSDDGASNWTLPPDGRRPNGRITVRLSVKTPLIQSASTWPADSGFYVSTDGGENWSRPGMERPRPRRSSCLGHGGGPIPGRPSAGRPEHRPHHGSRCTSSDYGVSWQAVTMPQAWRWITDIAFDPVTPGLVYLSTTAAAGNGSLQEHRRRQQLDPDR